jgi:hypothetical protein
LVRARISPAAGPLSFLKGALRTVVSHPWAGTLYGSRAVFAAAFVLGFLLTFGLGALFFL